MVDFSLLPVTETPGCWREAARGSRAGRCYIRFHESLLFSAWVIICYARCWQSHLPLCTLSMGQIVFFRLTLWWTMSSLKKTVLFFISTIARSSQPHIFVFDANLKSLNNQVSGAVHSIPLMFSIITRSAQQPLEVEWRDCRRFKKKKFFGDFYRLVADWCAFMAGLDFVKMLRRMLVLPPRMLVPPKKTQTNARALDFHCDPHTSTWPNAPSLVYRVFGGLKLVTDLGVLCGAEFKNRIRFCPSGQD